MYREWGRMMREGKILNEEEINKADFFELAESLSDAECAMLIPVLAAILDKPLE